MPALNHCEEMAEHIGQYTDVDERVLVEQKEVGRGSFPDDPELPFPVQQSSGVTVAERITSMLGCTDASSRNCSF